MLKELHIRNLAIIEEARMEFGPGFTVLTGETGAGKSILIDGLNLALGERADREMVRSGCDEAVVEALFDIGSLPEIAALLATMEVPDMGGELVLRRTVTAAGKSRCSANATPVPLVMMKKLGDRLVDLHGQHEHQLLLNPAMHLEFLDAFGGLLPARAGVRGAYLDWKACRQELDELRARDREQAARQELLSFQVGELDSARLKDGELESLQEERSRLANIQRIAEALGRAYEKMMGVGGAGVARGGAVADVRSAVDFDRKNLEPQSEALVRAQEAMLEAAGSIRAMQEGMEADPRRLEQVEERLDLLAKFQRKYGETVAQMLEYLERSRKDLQEVASSGERMKELEERAESLRKDLSVQAGKLSGERRQRSSDLALEVSGELRQLAMDTADFGVKTIQQCDSAGPVEMGGDRYQAGESGIDSVEFYIAPNVGAGTHPLKDVASGGELSRIMLALKSVLAKVDRVGTLVFDEIDTGIGGRVAEVIGRKLAQIGESRQVICITHLPQIAARSTGHFHVRKLAEGGLTRVEIKALDGKNRTREIARMLAGEEITDTAMRHAESMIKGG
jgi:DNA repair protein RecN (Recombination protein N)